jgi:hypothetical protein
MPSRDVQGCVCWLLLAAAWTWARGRRRKALMDRTRSLPPARAPSETSERRETQSPAAPAVSLVMPVKGVHSQSMDNWRTIVANEYGAWRLTPLQASTSLEGLPERCKGVGQQALQVKSVDRLREIILPRMHTLNRTHPSPL